MFCYGMRYAGCRRAATARPRVASALQAPMQRVINLVFRLRYIDKRAGTSPRTAVVFSFCPYAHYYTPATPRVAGRERRSPAMRRVRVTGEPRDSEFDVAATHVFVSSPRCCAQREQRVHTRYLLAKQRNRVTL